MRETRLNQQMAASFGLFRTATVIYATSLCACGSSASSTANYASDSSATNANTPMYTLTINNTYEWCNVTATIDGNQVAYFTDDSATLKAAAKSTVHLTATAQPGFEDPVWTGTTSTTDPTTYVMTTDANQVITVYCQ